MSPPTVPSSVTSKERATLFIDGSNFYFQLKNSGITPGQLNYRKLAELLVMDRVWTETRYYIGKVDPMAGPLFRDQQYFCDKFRSEPRHQVVYGTIQAQPTKNALAGELLTYLANLRTPIERMVYRDLVEMGKRHRDVITFKEKGVDVALACDMVRFAQSGAFDVAYLVSNDGDLRPAAEIVRGYGKKVFAVGCVVGPRLKEVCNSTIILKQDKLLACCYP